MHVIGNSGTVPHGVTGRHTTYIDIHLQLLPDAFIFGVVFFPRPLAHTALQVVKGGAVLFFAISFAQHICLHSLITKHDTMKKTALITASCSC